MNKKLEYLKKVAKPKKVSLAQMADLQQIVDELVSYDTEHQTSWTEELYDNAVAAKDTARLEANKYFERRDIMDDVLHNHWETYQKASELYQEISNQLYDLGVEPSPELEKMREHIAANEQFGQEAFQKTQDEFRDHNELLDISDFN